MNSLLSTTPTSTTPLLRFSPCLLLKPRTRLLSSPKSTACSEQGPATRVSDAGSRSRQHRCSNTNKSVFPHTSSSTTSALASNNSVNWQTKRPSSHVSQRCHCLNPNAPSTFTRTILGQAKCRRYLILLKRNKANTAFFRFFWPPLVSSVAARPSVFKFRLDEVGRKRGCSSLLRNVGRIGLVINV